MEGERKLSKRERPKGGRTIYESEPARIVKEEGIRGLMLDERKTISEYPEAAQMLGEWIDGLDFEALRSIYTEYLQKSGVDPERLNLVPREHIYLIEEVGAAGALMSYKLDLNSIQVNVPYFSRRIDHAPSSARVEFLQGLIHEYAHATSMNELRLEHSEHTDAKSAIRLDRSGFDHRFVTLKKSSAPDSGDYEKLSVFSLLNEGITERISHEVLIEYLHRTPQSEVDLPAAQDLIIDDMQNGKDAYAAARHFLIALTTALSEESGVPEDVVWRGFVRHYYDGEMRSDELMTLLNDTFGSDFGRTLMNVKNGTDIRELALSFPKISQHYPDTTRRWLAYLDVTHGAK